MNKESRIVKCKKCGMLTPDIYYDKLYDGLEPGCGGPFCVDCYKRYSKQTKRERKLLFLSLVIALILFVVVLLVFFPK